jgi:hypothetical protein
MIRLLGKLAYFSVLGFLFVTLIGPVLGILGTLLPFAVIGGLVWGGYRVVRRVVVGRRIEPRPEVVPVEVSPPRVEVNEAVVDRPWRRRFARTGKLLGEMAGGAIVAGGVAAVFCWGMPTAAETVITAVLAGAGIGFLVGCSSTPEAAAEARPVCDVAC